VNGKAQADIVKNNGVHMVTATPGRLKDLLHTKRMNLVRRCRLTLSNPH
jgi:ATP-dependent RNA helicase DDX41